MTRRWIAILVLAFAVAALENSAPRSTDAQPRKLPTDNAPSPASNFTVTQLANGVYACIRNEPPGFMVDANNIFIIGDQDVVVVDSNGAPGISKEVIAALRKITSKPVKYVINTHWHDDHIRGNQVYRDSFPGVEFIGHTSMRDYLPNQGAVNRKQFLEQAPQFLQALKGSIQAKKNLSGGPLSAEEQKSYESDVRLAEFVLTDGASAPAILPTIEVTDRLILNRGNREILIEQLGRGHTSADLVVFLPRERILITGDLVVWPIPLVGDPQSHIADWAVTLKKMLSLGATTIVPGHGQILRDSSYIESLEALFTSIATQTRDAVARGENIEQTRKSVKLEEFQKKFAGDSEVRKTLFLNYVVYPGVGAAFKDASKK